MRCLFASHDGFGLGHVRRNTLISAALLRRRPDASVAVLTGVAAKVAWLDDPRIRLVRVPPLLKAGDGSYRSSDLSFEDALQQRANLFRKTVERLEPDVVVVDRHPYGIGGELLPGLETAKRAGAAIVLGLRDILDEPASVRAELDGPGWLGVHDLFDEILVYGAPQVCDHVVEYGLGVTPRYCGWVVEQPLGASEREDDLLVIAAGGGGDGATVFALGLGALEARPDWRGFVVAGPYAADSDRLVERSLQGRVTVLADAPGCSSLFARASAVIEMAGYNSTFESLAAGVRPILVPRRSPRREQAIRASRLAALGLADVADETADPSELAWLLDRPRLLGPGALADAGIRLDGADVAARRIAELADRTAHRRVAVLPRQRSPQASSPVA